VIAHEALDALLAQDGGDIRERAAVEELVGVGLYDADAGW